MIVNSFAKIWKIVIKLTCVILQSSEKFTEAIQTALGDIKNMFLESKKL
jgi:hypothetical protein